VASRERSSRPGSPWPRSSPPIPARPRSQGEREPRAHGRSPPSALRVRGALGTGLVNRSELGRLTLVVLAVVVVQETVMLDIHVGGVHPDIMVLLPFVAGLVGGPSRGASVASPPAWCRTCFLPTPFGLSALVGLPRRLRRRPSPPRRSTVRPGGSPRSRPCAGAPSTRSSTGPLGSVLGQPQMLQRGPGPGSSSWSPSPMRCWPCRPSGWMFMGHGPGVHRRGCRPPRPAVGVAR